MAITRLPIWQQWLVHALVLWLGMELSDALSYSYQVYREGPYLINPNGSSVTAWQRFMNHNYRQGLWAVMAVGTLLVELNYHLIFRKKSIRFFLISTGLGSVGFTILLAYFNQWKFGGLPNPIGEPTLVVAAYNMGYALLRQYIQQRVDQTQQQIQLTNAELHALKAQINPHFFFNTLNTLYGTALLEQAEQTAQSIEQLASIMRYTVDRSRNDLVSVAEELTFITDYVQLQKLRLPVRENIQIQTELTYDEKPTQIAPLLLLPLVENAFKYGIRMDEPCFITLRLSVQQQELELVIENSLFPRRSDQPGLGTGLANTKKRLSLLYPDKHQLSIQSLADRYCVRLHLTLH